jgi:hypothetical protein
MNKPVPLFLCVLFLTQRNKGTVSYALHLYAALNA